MAIGTGISPTYKWSSRFPVIKEQQTATVNTGAIAANTTNITTVTITGEGCNVGDGVILLPGTDLLGCQYCGYVSAANTVKIAVSNVSAGSLTPASSTWGILILYAGDATGGVGI